MNFTKIEAGAKYPVFEENIRGPVHLKCRYSYYHPETGEKVKYGLIVGVEKYGELTAEETIKGIWEEEGSVGVLEYMVLSIDGNKIIGMGGSKSAYISPWLYIAGDKEIISSYLTN